MWRSVVRGGGRRKKSNTLTHQGKKRSGQLGVWGAFKKVLHSPPPPPPSSSSFSFPPPQGEEAERNGGRKKGGKSERTRFGHYSRGKIQFRLNERRRSFLFFALGKNFYETKSTFIPRIHINMHSMEMRGELMGEVLLRLSFHFPFLLFEKNGRVSEMLFVFRRKVSYCEAMFSVWKGSCCFEKENKGF